jgi:hypothetical protein
VSRYPIIASPKLRKESSTGHHKDLAFIIVTSNRLLQNVSNLHFLIGALRKSFLNQVITVEGLGIVVALWANEQSPP